MQELLRDRLSIASIGFFAITLGPLCEELVFRGFLQPLLIRTFGVAAGILLCAVPFALLHGPQYALVVAACAADSRPVLPSAGCASAPVRPPPPR